MSFASRLKRVRKAARITRYRLAISAGLTTQSVLYLESGQRQPTWETVQKLVAALGCEYVDLAKPPRKKV